jgi:O-antigen/teichoic acid export membrane protein
VIISKNTKLLSWLSLAKLGEIFSALIVGSLLVRNLSTYDYGVFTYWISITSFVSILASLGLDKYELNRHRKESAFHFKSVFSLRLFSTLFLCLCIILFGVFSGNIKYALPASFMILVKIFDHFRNRLLAENKSNLMYSIDVKKIFIGSMLRLITISLMPKVEILLLTYCVEVVYLLFVFRENITESFKSFQTNLKPLILKILPLTISAILLGLYSKADFFIVDFFNGKDV